MIVGIFMFVRVGRVGIAVLEKSDPRHYADVHPIEYLIFRTGADRKMRAVHPRLLYAAAQRPFAVCAYGTEIMQMHSCAPHFMIEGIKRPAAESDFVPQIGMIVIMVVVVIL